MDTNWFEVIPIHRGSLIFEFVLNVEFPTSACCPIVHLRYNQTNHCTIPDCCFDGDLVEQRQAYYRTKYFLLYQNDNQKSIFVNCTLALGHHICHVKIKGLSYNQKPVWLDFGYPCDDRNNSLKGLKYSVTDVINKNITTCEPVPNVEPFMRKQFYSHTTFPNILGLFNTLETLDYIDLLRNIFRADRLPCHKHLFYMVCQTYFTRCPERNTTDIGNNTIYEVDRLVPLCKEMCYDFKKACAIDFQPMVNVIDCHSIPYSKETSNCVYMEVFCTNPPVQMPNGPDTYPANSILEYSCKSPLVPVKKNPTITCTFTGQWTDIPECIIATQVPVVVPIIAILTFAIIII